MTFRSMSARMVEKLRVLLGAGLEAGVPALPGKTEVVGGGAKKMRTPIARAYTNACYP